MELVTNLWIRGSTASGGAPSQFTSNFVSYLLERGELQSYITKTLRPAYARRYRQMMSAIEKHLLPLGVELPQPSRDIVGGYFVWLSLPKPLKGAEVTRRAKEDANLVVAPGELFEVPGDAKHASFAQNVRLCFSWEDEWKLEQGVERLGRVISRMQSEGESRTGDGVASLQPHTDNGQDGKEDARNYC